MRSSRRVLAIVSSALLAGTVVAAGHVAAAGGSSPGPVATVTTRVVKGGQQAHLAKGTAGAGEVAPAIGEEAATERTPVANRSMSSQAKKDRGGPGLSNIPAANTAIVPAAATTSFEA